MHALSSRILPLSEDYYQRRNSMLAYYSIYTTFPKQTPNLYDYRKPVKNPSPFTTQQCIIFLSLTNHIEILHIQHVINVL